LSKSRHLDVCSPVAAEGARNLSGAVKSELDCVSVGQREAVQASLSAAVSSPSSPCQVIPANVCTSISLKQEPRELINHQDERLGLVTGCERGLLHGVEVKHEPLSPVACRGHSPAESSTTYHSPSLNSDTARLTSSACSDYQLSSTHGQLTFVDSLCSHTASAGLMVGASADEVTAADTRRDCDSSAAVSAAADGEDDVNLMMSQSLTASSETSHLPVVSLTVLSSVCDSRCSSASPVSSTASSLPQQLVMCRDSLGKTYSIPRRLLLRVLSSSVANCIKSPTDCSLPSAYSAPRSASITSVTMSHARLSSGKGGSLLSVRDVNAKPDVTVKTIGPAVEQQSSLTTAACSLSGRVTNSNTSTAAASTAVTLPLSARGTLAVSCHSSMLTNAAVMSRHVHKVRLTSEKAQTASGPYSMVNNAVIKPRPLVPLSGVNSPARSLPHITVLPCVTRTVMSTNRNMTPASNSVAARMPPSSNQPVYLVLEGNNRVASANTRAVKEVVLVPGTKNSTVKGVKMCSVQAGPAAGGMNGRCTNMLTTGLSQCDGVTKVSVVSASSSLPSVVCVTSLNRNCKPAQTSRSAGQISLLRPQHIASSTAISKPSLLEPKIQTKRTSLSSSNVIATKIGNQTVIVEVPDLSSSSLAAAKPSVTAVAPVCSTKPKDMLVSRTACSQQEVTSRCGNIQQQSSALRAPVTSDMDSPFIIAPDNTSENCTPVIRYVNYLCVFFKTFLSVYFNEF